MGLVKHKAVQLTERGKPQPGRGCNELAEALEGADAASRRQAARDIVHVPDAAGALVSRLKREDDAAVREVILNALVRLSDPSAFGGLVDCLRDENPALRNETIETFKQLGQEADPILKSLLADPDPDVRIFAVSILGSRRHGEAESRLIEVIENESHVNVCAAAVDPLCEIGTEASRDSLVRLKARFASEPYIQFACELALRRMGEI
jgi:HEAT repeat protein